MLTKNLNIKLGIIGLGYVGLPLAVEFGKNIETIAHDINVKRINELKLGIDKTLEVLEENMNSSKLLRFTNDIMDLKECNYYIVTVPTPIDKNNNPDLSFLESASESLGKIIGVNDIVIFESTVFPGATEEICCPILEKYSGLKFNKDFFCGYSPERINPGDKVHKITDIIKVTSGSNHEVAIKVDNLYKIVALAGTHKASSMKVAEAAKVIENIQRDINIALINEISIICEKLNIETKEVLSAARTKWNFLDFKPGLVGGHCIGIDPYYLTYRAKQAGYEPELILAGRKLNESMSKIIVNTFINLMLTKNINLSNPKVLILGLTFKENCPDLRNSKVFDLVEQLKLKNFDVDVFDPWVSKDLIKDNEEINLVNSMKKDYYDGAIVAVGHDCYKDMLNREIISLVKKTHVIYDMKYLLDPNLVTSSI